MKSENKLYHVKTITAVKDPRRVRYLDNDRIVVGSSGCGLSIVNLKTNAVQKINDDCMWKDYLTPGCLQIHNKKIIWTHHTTISVHDAVTGKRQWFATTDGHIRSFACHPSDNSLYLCFGEKKSAVTKYDYITNQCTDIFVAQSCQVMSIHPKEKVMSIAGFGSEGVSLFQIPLHLGKKADICKKGSFICQYSPDGSHLVTGNSDHLTVFDSNYKKGPEFLTDPHEFVRAIAFHPNHNVLAILSYFRAGTFLQEGPQRYQHPQVVRFFNMNTHTLIEVLPALYTNVNSYDLAFSDDGLEMIVVLNDRCMRVLVPFAVKQKCIPCLWVLHQLAEQHSVPVDVVHHCGRVLLESYKF